MPERLALIADKSQSYIGYQRERLLALWGRGADELKHVNRVRQAGVVTLFGESLTSLLTLTTVEEIRTAVEDFQSLSAPQISALLSSGLIIDTSVARTSTKKLESAVAAVGGEVITTAQAKKEGSVAASLTAHLSLSSDAREFLLAYVGDDYEAVLPLVRSLENLTPEAQRRVSGEDLFLRMPQAPGSLPPWEIEKPLLAKDISKTIEIFRRVSQNSHLLVVLKILNNRFRASYRISSLLTHEPSLTNDELSTITGVSGRTIWLHRRAHETQGNERLQRIVETLAHTENLVKAGGAANGEILMELCLIRLTSIIR